MIDSLSITFIVLLGSDRGQYQCLKSSSVNQTSNGVGKEGAILLVVVMKKIATDQN